MKNLIEEIKEAVEQLLAEGATPSAATEPADGDMPVDEVATMEDEG